MWTSQSESLEPDERDPYDFTLSAPASNESPASDLPPTDTLVESPTRASLAPPSRDPVPVFIEASQAQIMEWWFERGALLTTRKACQDRWRSSNILSAHYGKLQALDARVTEITKCLREAGESIPEDSANSLLIRKKRFA